jgi:uncharacterized protein (DUF885 family)
VQDGRLANRGRRRIKRFFKWTGGIVGLLLLAAAALIVHTVWFKPLKIDWFFERVLIEVALDDPELLSQIGVLDGIGIRGHNARLSDGSEARELALFAKARRDLETLRRYDRERLDARRKLSYDMLGQFLELTPEMERWRHHNYPMNQLFGIQNGLPNFMATIHRVEDRKGAEHYIARLAQFDRRLDQALQGVQRRAALGVIPPTFVVEKVLEEMRGFVGVPARENILHTALDGHLGKLVEAGTLTEAERAELGERAEAEIRATVYPVYGRLIAYYEELLPQTRGNHGVWALPDGDEYYRFAIRLMTTTELPADEIHAIGLAEVARIGREMDAILRAQGHHDGTLGERIVQLKSNPAQLYENSDAGRARIIADYQLIIDEIDAGLGPHFDLRPAVGVKVERVPEFREAGSALAYYQPPSLDGVRPGVFYINLREVGDLPRFGMRTLAYHEAIPGHHFQIAIAQQLQGLPMFRRMVPLPAYTEGWALYTEQLAWELGFQDDPLDNLGRLQAEMFRAVRLVVDTGLHARRWTREQAIDYMLEHTGMGEKEAIAETERYLVRPGQALAYKVGMLKILELRERARQALGDNFELREFHNVVLGNGALPLDLLERVVDDWLNERRRGLGPDSANRGFSRDQAFRLQASSSRSAALNAAGTRWARRSGRASCAAISRVANGLAACTISISG